MQIRHQSSLISEFTKHLANRPGANVSDGTAGASDFGGLLLDGIKSVNDQQATSQQSIDALLTGKDIDTAEVVSSIQKADMAFQLLVQVRNKLMKAYEEIQAINI